MQGSPFLPDWSRNARIRSQRAEVWAWLAQHNLSLLLEKSLRAPVVLTGYWPQSCWELPTSSKMPNQCMYSWEIPMPFHPNVHLHLSTLGATLMAVASYWSLTLHGAVLSGLHAFSHSHLRVIPCNVHCFYSPFVGEKTVAADFPRAPNPLTGRARTPIEVLSDPRAHATTPYTILPLSGHWTVEILETGISPYLGNDTYRWV